MGCELSPEAIKLFASDLEFLADDVIVNALVRCRRELRARNGFAPMLTIADVLDRAGVVSEAAALEAEGRAAWDALQLYVRRHVATDGEGAIVERDFIGAVSGRIPRPELSQRLRDTVRRVGGWQAVRCIDPEDFPHVQRRFFEEYRNWTATETVAARLALEGVGEFKALIEGKSMSNAIKRIAAKGQQ